MLKKKIGKLTSQPVGSELLNEIEELIEKVNELNEVIDEKYELYINEVIHPMKIGDTVLASIKIGTITKPRKAVLEQENRILYARPIKEDGKLSNKRYHIPMESAKNLLQEV